MGKITKEWYIEYLIETAHVANRANMHLHSYHAEFSELKPAIYEAVIEPLFSLMELTGQEVFEASDLPESTDWSARFEAFASTLKSSE